MRSLPRILVKNELSPILQLPSQSQLLPRTWQHATNGDEKSRSMRLPPIDVCPVPLVPARPTRPANRLRRNRPPSRPDSKSRRKFHWRSSWWTNSITNFISYKNHNFSAQPGKRDRDNYRQLTTMFLNFELIWAFFLSFFLSYIFFNPLRGIPAGSQPLPAGCKALWVASEALPTPFEVSDDGKLLFRQ